MRVEVGVAELVSDRLDEMIGHCMFEPFGFVVNFVQLITQLAHKVQLDQAVAADDFKGDFFAVRRQHDALILLIIHKSGGDKALGSKKQYFRRKKLCRFCVDKIDDINYKDTKLLNSFISERGKVTPRRISGVCAPHQRRLAEAIKQARSIALLPFSSPV